MELWRTMGSLWNRRLPVRITHLGELRGGGHGADAGTTLELRMHPVS